MGPKSKVACETATKDNMVMVAGEITTQAKLDYEKVVREAVKGIGYDTYVDDLSSVDSKGLSFKTCEVLVRINKQSPDIAGGVHVGKEEMDVGAGDQGIMFGYASDETEDCKLTADDITNVLKVEFDCRPGAIALSLALREPKYQVTAAYCHFGRAPYTKDGIKFFEWENAKDMAKYAGMDSAQVTAALTASNYLQKWVD